MGGGVGGGKRGEGRKVISQLASRPLRIGGERPDVVDTPTPVVSVNLSHTFSANPSVAPWI